MSDWKMKPMTDFATFPDQGTARRPVVTRASDTPPKHWTATLRDVIDAVDDVLPDDQKVLPGGRKASKAIAHRASELYKARNE